MFLATLIQRPVNRAGVLGGSIISRKRLSRVVNPRTRNSNMRDVRTGGK
jgi:hypothetical protein